MRTDTRDMVSVTEAGRNFGRLSTEVAQGRTLVVLRNNEPTVAIVSIEKMEQLSRIEELEEDLKMLTIAAVRTLTDDGSRHSLEDVAAEFGVDLDEMD